VLAEQEQEEVGGVTKFLYRQAEIVTGFQGQLLEMSATLEHAIVCLANERAAKSIAGAASPLR
jgi:hypothetical protein